MCLEWKSYVETFSMEDRVSKRPQRQTEHKKQIMYIGILNLK